MAKKGTVADINGFISVGSDGPKTKPKKPTPTARKPEPKPGVGPAKKVRTDDKPKSNPVKPGEKPQPGKTAVKTSTTARPTPQRSNAARVPLNPKTGVKPKNNSPITSSSKVLGRSGLSYTVELDKSKKTNTTKTTKPGTNRPVVTKSIKPTASAAPPTLTKQKTFVRDEAKYEEDFEEYESDFEDVSGTSTSAQNQMRKDNDAPLTCDGKADEKPTESKSENIYEDDFEEYESDFEDDTESGFTSPGEGRTGADTESESEMKPRKNAEEEKKLDSGNYDLTRRTVKTEALKQRQLNEIKEAISRENTLYTEGLTTETSKLKDEDPNIPQSDLPNFRTAYTKTESKKFKSKASQRGYYLLQMISLHPVHINIFELSPTPYEDFIRMYGNRNSVQVCTQTTENAITEETQTDAIFLDNKWTQFPPEYHRWENNGKDFAIYLEDRLSTGDDEVRELTKVQLKVNYDENKLRNFLNSAGEVMIVLLEEESRATVSLKPKTDFGFSDGFIKISTDHIHFLKDRNVTRISFSPHNPNNVAAVHQTSLEEKNTETEVLLGRSIITLWDILSPTYPQHFLVSPSKISSVAFDGSYPHIVYAGLHDGTICAWDLSERKDYHLKNEEDVPYMLRSPTYCTFNFDDPNTESQNHMDSIINLISIGNQKQIFESGILPPTQLVSISQEGKLKLWSVLHVNNDFVDLNDIGLSPWGGVKLSLVKAFTPSSRFSNLALRFIRRLRSPQMLPNFAYNQLKRRDAQFHSMAVCQGSALLGSNIGVVLNVPLTGTKPKVPTYGEIDEALKCTCIELCPSDANLFMVGISDGSFKLYHIQCSKSLMTYAGHNEIGSIISTIKWSSLSPGVLFVLDESSKIHVWDICRADIVPQFTVSIQKWALTTMDQTQNAQFPYLGLIKNSSIQIHQVKRELAPKKSDPQQFKMFKIYIDNLF